MTDDDECECECDDKEFSRRTKETRQRTTELTRDANAFSKAITSAFAQGVTGAKSFDTVLKSLGQRLSSLALNMALRPVTNSLAKSFEQLFSGISGTFTGGDTKSNLLPHNDATTTAFAKGGIIAAPTYFPLAGNRLGVAGEAGPEAIIPLSRGPDGRLGVASAGSGAANVTVNIATPDAESFRRSETYLTGLIARAVSRGQRGL